MSSTTRERGLLAAVVLLAAACIGTYAYYGGQLREARQASVRQTRQEMRSVIREFHKMFYDSPNTWRRNSWMGVLTEQNPNDVWVTQEIIVETAPDVIVETGTMHGGSSILWAGILEEVNPNGRVITIDIADRTARAQKVRLFREKVDFLLGSSTAPEIVEEVKRRVAGRKVMVILDSDHSEAHVSKELEIYAPLVSKDSYLIVQDTNVNGHPVQPDYGPGPLEAVEKFMAGNDDFTIDRRRERLLFTMHPKGYLRRVK